ncbi:MAG: DUF4037 domain-containing protein [Candidatus Obscuribacterales bacterium]
MGADAVASFSFLTGAEFIPGLDLSERFFREAIKPVLDRHWPGTTYSAALIGDGSEVLGFDTPMSSDHDWGPRAQIFLSTGADHERLAADMAATLAQHLPREFLGYPTRAAGEHRVEILTPAMFFMEHLGFDIERRIEPADWLTFPQQKLATATAGRVFQDDGGLLQAVRERFLYYPHDVWLYLLAAGWKRIEQEEHLMGRAGYVGDEIGSALIAARLVRDLMRLCFLMERRYAPYPKWFGTAFARLAAAADLQPHLRRTLAAGDWQEREQHLCAAYTVVAARHNALGITEALPAETKTFHDRPFKVISMGEFSEAIKRQIKDETVKAIAARRLYGGIDQLSDSTDIVEGSGVRTTLRELY